jgi:hypothetical protein
MQLNNAADINLLIGIHPSFYYFFTQSLRKKDISTTENIASGPKRMSLFPIRIKPKKEEISPKMKPRFSQKKRYFTWANSFLCVLKKYPAYIEEEITNKI